MNYKEELNRLVDIVKEHAAQQHKRVLGKEFAARMGIKNDKYWSQLLGKGAEVTEDHIRKFKDVFSPELRAAGIPMPGDPINDLNALFLGMIEDYCDRMGVIENVDPKEIRKRVDLRAKKFLRRLDE